MSNTGREATTSLALITGPAGAGRTTAIHAFEDLGFEVIDNIPLSLVPRLVDGPSLGRPVALGLDVRNREFSTSAVLDLIDLLTANSAIALEVIYLDCSEDELIRRFNQTRRRHPLALEETPTQGIAREIDLLLPIKARADHLIDTTEMSPHDLKAEIGRVFARDSMAHMAVSVQSFSYKRGLPRGLDVVMDCRFLNNPHWEPLLRDLDGRDPKVAEFVAADPLFDAFFAQVRDLILLLVPAYRKEGKAHLSLGFGCTGGQHRSVVLVEKMTKVLAEGGWPVSKRHRELERKAASIL